MLEHPGSWIDEADVFSIVSLEALRWNRLIVHTQFLADRHDRGWRKAFIFALRRVTSGNVLCDERSSFGIMRKATRFVRRHPVRIIPMNVARRFPLQIKCRDYPNG